MGAEKGVKILSKKINEPKTIENSELFITFAELEVEIDDLMKLFTLVFVYMPSHVEIVKPSKVEISNFDINAVCNELTRKLHEYDGIAKRMMLEKEILERRLKEKHGENFLEVKDEFNMPEKKQEKATKKRVKKSSSKKKKS
jgi:hypothetical protein